MSVCDKNCTDEEYGKLKTQLLRLQNRKFAQSPDAEGLGQDELSIKKFLVTMMFEYWDLDNDGQVSSNDIKEKFLVTMMFEYWDLDNDGQVSSNEMGQVMKREDELAEVMTSCTLYEMLKYDDINDDHRVDIDEFYNAFGPISGGKCGFISSLLWFVGRLNCQDGRENEFCVSAGTKLAKGDTINLLSILKGDLKRRALGPPTTEKKLKELRKLS
ncbi:Follistatin- protein 5 [Branchiostoma belcheri]|nr:Follistatin- protein 5 [Branchiostoma belcheri]